MAACPRRVFRYFRISSSSFSSAGMSLVANQRDEDCLTMPSRSPIGCVFWPILLALLNLHVNLHVARALDDRCGSTLSCRREPLQWLPAIDDRLLDEQGVNVQARVLLERLLLGVRNGRFQRLCNLLGRELLVELQDRVRLVHVLAANEIDDEPHLSGRLAHQPLNRMTAHGYSGFAFLSATILPLWPRKSRVGANSPSLWPTMFSVTYTGTNLFPLCTAKVWPTNSGRIVLARLQVFTTRFSFLLLRT